MTKPKTEKKPRVPISQDAARLSKAATRAMAASEGQRICKQFMDDDRFSGPAFWFEPSGHRLPREAAEELIRKGRFLPVQDGLFAGDSQSFARAHR